MEVDGWKISYFDPTVQKTVYNTSYCDITDKFGNVKKLSRIWDILSNQEIALWNEKGITMALKFVAETLSRFDKWSDFGTFKENIKLKEEIRRLNRQNEENQLFIKKIEAIFGEKLKDILLKEGSEVIGNDEIIMQLLEQQSQKYTKIKEIIVNIKNTNDI